MLPACLLRSAAGIPLSVLRHDPPCPSSDSVFRLSCAAREFTITALDFGTQIGKHNDLVADSRICIRDDLCPIAIVVRLVETPQLVLQEPGLENAFLRSFGQLVEGDLYHSLILWAARLAAVLGFVFRPVEAAHWQKPGERAPFVLVVDRHCALLGLRWHTCR